jgi:hypothetical protein
MLKAVVVQVKLCEVKAFREVRSGEKAELG